MLQHISSNLAHDVHKELRQVRCPAPATGANTTTLKCGSVSEGCRGASCYIKLDL